MIRNGERARTGGDQPPGKRPVVPRTHRYRASRPWTVVLLAAIAAGGPVLVTGAVSTTIAENGMPIAPAMTQPETRPEWQIQLGTFERRAAAVAHLRTVAETTPGISGHALRAEAYGSLTRARVAGFADEAEARRACRAFVDRGNACFIVRAGRGVDAR